MVELIRMICILSTVVVWNATLLYTSASGEIWTKLILKIKLNLIKQSQCFNKGITHSIAYSYNLKVTNCIPNNELAQRILLIKKKKRKMQKHHNNERDHN